MRRFFISLKLGDNPSNFTTPATFPHYFGVQIRANLIEPAGKRSLSIGELAYEYDYYSG
jgi:hypothetical protein